MLHITSIDYTHLMSPDRTVAPYVNNTTYNIIHVHNLIGKHDSSDLVLEWKME